MPTAFCFLPLHLERRRAAFEAGLAALGYTIAGPVARGPSKSDDVLVMWNRRSYEHAAAVRHEAIGGRVIVAENGYIGCAPDGGKLYALALSHHSGAGAWRVGGPERFASIGVELKPWRQAGDHVVLLVQRGIGEPGIAMDPRWPAKAAQMIAHSGKRVLIRNHPGRDKSEPYGDLDGAYCAVTWASGAGIKALAAGIPVFHGLPRWIGADGARWLGPNGDISAPLIDDARRLAMFERLAWAQWSLAEIESGEAFAWLLK